MNCEVLRLLRCRLEGGRGGKLVGSPVRLKVREGGAGVRDLTKFGCRVFCGCNGLNCFKTNKLPGPEADGIPGQSSSVGYSTLLSVKRLGEEAGKPREVVNKGKKSEKVKRMRWRSGDEGDEGDGALIV